MPECGSRRIIPDLGHCQETSPVSQHRVTDAAGLAASDSEPQLSRSHYRPFFQVAAELKPPTKFFNRDFG